MSAGSPAVLFDLDDTLYAERDYLASGRRAVAREAERRGLMEAGEAYALMLQAPDAFDALHEVCPAFAVAEMVQVYRRHRPELSLAPATARLLRELRAEGAATGVITDGRSLGQRLKLQALGLEPLLDYTGISEETGADKHSALPFLAARRALGEQRPYIYVGDNPAKDFARPNALGWHTVMLREPREGANIHPQRLGGLPAGYMPDFIINDLQEIRWIYSRVAAHAEP